MWRISVNVRTHHINVKLGNLSYFLVAFIIVLSAIWCPAVVFKEVSFLLVICVLHPHLTLTFLSSFAACWLRIFRNVVMECSHGI